MPFEVVHAAEQVTGRELSLARAAGTLSGIAIVASGVYIEAATQQSTIGRLLAAGGALTAYFSARRGLREY